MNISYIKILHW